MARWALVLEPAAEGTRDPGWFVVLGGIGLFTFFVVGIVQAARGKVRMSGESLFEEDDDGQSTRAWTRGTTKLPRRRRYAMAALLLGTGMWSAFALAGSNVASGVVVGAVSLTVAVLTATGVAPFGTDNTKSKFWQ